jgi:ABC-2 type transport system permease protein
MGFVSKVEEDGVDYPTFVTAHEIAHQWWGHQLIGADVQGAGMLSESFSEYSALMLMTKGASEDRIRKFTRNELDYYLKGRSGEDRKELPLALVEGQQYIQYYKGSLILYAIQDIIGEKTLNNVLKKTLERSRSMSNSPIPVYPTTRVFTEELSASLPDSLQYLVNDWIDQITFYDLKAEKAKASKKNKGYEVTLELEAKKTMADSLGKETDKKFAEWICIYQR